MCENAQTSIFGKPRYLHLTSFKNRKISTKNSGKPEIGIPGNGKTGIPGVEIPAVKCQP